MAEFPALPIWTDAYLADCSHLSDAEHGIYFQLLMLMWRSPECRIPDDDEWIARRMKRDANAVRTHVRPLMHEFCDVHSGWVTQKRLRKEWAWLKEKRKKNAQSAKSRWNKEKDACERTSERICERNAPTPTPTPLINNTNTIGGTRLSPDWKPDEEAIRMFMVQSLIPLEWLSDQLALFKAHYQSAPNEPHNTSPDWTEKFKKWLINCKINAAKVRKNGNNAHSSSTTATSPDDNLRNRVNRTARLIDELRGHKTGLDG